MEQTQPRQDLRPDAYDNFFMRYAGPKLTLDQVFYILKWLAEMTGKREKVRWTEEEMLHRAFDAGRDCAMNSPDLQNCDLIFFLYKTSARSWKAGYESGLQVFKDGRP